MDEKNLRNKEEFFAAISPLLQTAEANKRSGLMTRATEFFHDPVSRLASASAASRNARDEGDRKDAKRRMQTLENKLDILRDAHQEEWQAWDLQLRVTAMVQGALENKIIKSLSELEPLK